MIAVGQCAWVQWHWRRRFAACLALAHALVLCEDLVAVVLVLAHVARLAAVALVEKYVVQRIVVVLAEGVACLALSAHCLPVHLCDDCSKS